MDRIEQEIAGIVDGQFRGEPIPERQRNKLRDGLVSALTAYAKRLKNDFYSSNRTIHTLEERLATVRAEVAEEIAQSLQPEIDWQRENYGNSTDPADQAAIGRLIGMEDAQRLIREHGKES